MNGRQKPGLFPRLNPRRKCRCSRLKGKMQNVIVVKPPNPMFKQAVFFLREDYFLSSDISREELLQQANSAAASFVSETVPEAGFKKTIIIISTAFIIAAGILILIFYLI